MYVVVLTKENGSMIYRLHAVDITTGQDKMTPAVISGTVAGNGKGSVNGQMTFDPHVERQRGAILFSQGHLYIPFASFCDNGNYHGWIFSYDPNGSTFQQTGIYNSSTQGWGVGLWGGEGALSADSSGNIYAETGNGDFNLNATNGQNSGDSFIKLSPNLQLEDYFTPFNQLCLEQTDADLGSGTPLIIPGTNMMVGSGKEGRLYLLNMANMGKYTPDPNLSCTNATEKSRTNVDKIVQELPPSTIGGLYSTPTYWNNKVFFGGYNDSVKAFSFNDNGSGLLSTKPVAVSALGAAPTGGSLDVSSNGTAPNTAILWMLDRKGILHAYNPDDLSQEFYNSTQVAGDAVDSFVKFTTVTVANGKVYVPTATSLTIYGLRPPVPPTPTATGTSTVTPTATATGTPTPNTNYNNIGISDDTNPGSANLDGGHFSYSFETLKNAGINPGSTFTYNNMPFVWPNVPAGQADNYVPGGQVLPVTPVTNANLLGIIGTSINGATSGIGSITYTDGTTQAFTIGFGDWTLNAGRSPISFNNGIVATLPYRNGTNGQNAVTTYLFYTDVTTQQGKTIQSVTLPTTTSGGQLHIFTIGTRYVPPTPVTFNNAGTADDSNPGGSNLDGGHVSYSKQALQAAGINPGDNAFYNYNKMVFWWPDAQPGQPDNYVPAGQTVPVTPVANADLLGFVGAATGGPSTGRATINYTDGTTQTFNLGFSDWTLNGGRAPVSYGNGVFAVMPYRDSTSGQNMINTYVFYTDVFMQAGKTVESVTLPKTTTGGVMHIFAIATKQVTNPGGTPSSAPYNNVGMSSDAAPAGGSFDGRNSYSSQAGQSAGLVPGASVNVYNTTFVWPSPDSGYLNNYVANGQVIPVTPVDNAGTVAFLGAANNGPSHGLATITYTDGTTQNIDLGFSDWTLGAGSSSLAYGNQIAISMPYRNTQNGRDNTQTFIFYAEFKLAAGETIQSVTLPKSVNAGTLHVFSVATHAGAPYTGATYNNVGITNDNNTKPGQFDGSNSYSAQTLQSAGAKEGAQFTYKGTTFIWTGGAPGTANNYTAQGQTIPVNYLYGSSTIAFLGSSVGGSSSGAVTINYADGTTSTITLNFSDWTLNAGKVQPVAGNSAAMTLNYRNTQAGRQNVNTYVFYSEFLIPNYDVPVVSVTLPKTSQMHIFAVATR
jgi:hypothetical protein